MEDKLVCFECAKKAKWVRHTQFAGDHYYCKKHAKEQEDFKISDSYKYWAKK